MVSESTLKKDHRPRFTVIVIIVIVDVIVSPALCDSEGDEKNDSGGRGNGVQVLTCYSLQHCKLSLNAVQNTFHHVTVSLPAIGRILNDSNN